MSNQNTFVRSTQQLIEDIERQIRLIDGELFKVEYDLPYSQKYIQDLTYNLIVDIESVVHGSEPCDKFCKNELGHLLGQSIHLFECLTDVSD